MLQLTDGCGNSASKKRFSVLFDCYFCVEQFFYNFAKNVVKIMDNEIKIGMILKGTVINVTNFGVFIDLGSATGLLPKSKIYDQRNPDLYSIGQTVKVIVETIKNNRILLMQYMEYDKQLFYINTEELLQYLGFMCVKFTGQAKKGKDCKYFINLTETDTDKQNSEPRVLLHPFTKKNISARCSAESICLCSLDHVEQVCAENSICREQIAMLDSVVTNHFYEVELIAGKNGYRKKYNDPFRFNVHRIIKEISLNDRNDEIKDDRNDEIKAEINDEIKAETDECFKTESETEPKKKIDIKVVGKIDLTLFEKRQEQEKNRKTRTRTRKKKKETPKSDL
jgi:predicted RNA-binding protein with RPS1 domain